MAILVASWSATSIQGRACRYDCFSKFRVPDQPFLFENLLFNLFWEMVAILVASWSAINSATVSPNLEFQINLSFLKIFSSTYFGKRWRYWWHLGLPSMSPLFLQIWSFRSTLPFWKIFSLTYFGKWWRYCWHLGLTPASRGGLVAMTASPNLEFPINPSFLKMFSLTYFGKWWRYCWHLGLPPASRGGLVAMTASPNLEFPINPSFLKMFSLTYFGK